MKNQLWVSRAIQIATVAAVLSGCGHGIKKADIPANAVPSDEISRLDADVNKAYEDQLDIVAAKEFAKARSYVDEAKSDLRKGRKQSTTLEDVGYARAWLEKANSVGQDHGQKIRGLLDARKAALDAGARDYPQHQRTLGALDDKTRSVTSGSMSPDKFNRIQSDYYDLELAAIQSKNLDKAEANLNAAKKNRSESYAPKYTKAAEIDLTDAKNKIAVNRHNPDAFKDAVNKALTSAQFVAQTTEVARGKGEPAEDVAAEIVKQRMQISSLKGDLGDAAGEQAVLSNKLTEQGQQLAEASAAQRLDHALKSAAKEFKKSEAEVYRQGDKLLIRLKDIKFPTGKADLPPNSLPLLAKVKNIASSLNPTMIVIEGHTDSTGTSAVNLPLSQERAQAVSTYFEKNGVDSDKLQAVGKGDKVPLTSNKTKEGKAKNRRVDVIVTPAASN